MTNRLITCISVFHEIFHVTIAPEDGFNVLYYSTVLHGVVGLMNIRLYAKHTW